MDAGAQQALDALERLLGRGVVTPEQARLAARLITGDPALEFPPRAAGASDDPSAPRSESL